MRVKTSLGPRQLSVRRGLQRIRTEVILGSPSANCSGVGICRVMAYGEGAAPEKKCPSVTAWLSVTETSRLRLEFEKATLSREALRQHFQWYLFQVMEPYVISYRLLRGLTIAQRTIRPGVYLVWATHTHLIVEF